MVKPVDLTGNQYGRLTVIKLSDQKLPSSKYKRLWECRCKCGNTKIVEGYWLTNGNIISCGCKRKEHHNLMEHARDIIEKDYRVSGVDVTKLNLKQRANTSTGHKGVYPYKHSKYNYSAAIGIKGELIQLGKFVTLDQAIEARKAAEEKYFKPYLDEHKSRTDV